MDLFKLSLGFYFYFIWNIFKNDTEYLKKIKTDKIKQAYISFKLKPSGQSSKSSVGAPCTNLTYRTSPIV